MVRPIAILTLLAFAAPAAAQVRGICTNGSLWWAEGRLAGLGPCESPEEGFFVLACGPDGVTLDAESEMGVAEGDPTGLLLSVDGEGFYLDGTGTLFPRSGFVGVGRAPVPPEALAALRRGTGASFAFKAETRDIHLTGSNAAIGSMLQACGG
ncbi:hypothetical protein [Jannaschia aquimarina]|uniref:Uncharacterized protein n=1 Tax=Jannaschia aquimarina TaxID=935700 RepID=A0A0D1CIF0_9RHOB|nr:hypothetical protein [Jannaschia aquimarina]KIT14487.1 hypothetical protein jaqu_37770 [Jannaschia aquimarina]SNT28675.1 hypothetical protein SAMN05421775_11022 [Jannaschia aquimarina]